MIRSFCRWIELYSGLSSINFSNTKSNVRSEFACVENNERI